MTWLLRGLAVLLAIGAAGAALLGYRLSTQPEPAQPVKPKVQLVHAGTALRAGEPITAEQLELREASERPADSFDAIRQVAGQSPAVDVAAGALLGRAHFQFSRHLLQSLRDGERAVAIKVDEVAGLAGFARPGDRVDVLLHLRGSQETANATSAQVLLADARLLAYGQQTQAVAAGEDEGAAAKGKEKKPERQAHSSAVLAVPEAAASRLMLGASSGNLRLALRPLAAAPAVAAPPPPPDPTRLVRLPELVGDSPAAKPAPAKTAVRKSAPPPAIPIHEGNAVRTVALPSR